MSESGRLFTVREERHPDLPGMMLATMRSLRAMGGSANKSELDDHVIETEGLTEEEQSLTMPNDRRPKANYYLAWARTYLKRGGAIRNSSRGVWAVSEHGEDVQSYSQCQAIFDAVQAEERERARLRRRQDDVSPTAADTPDDPSGEVDDTEGTGWEQDLLRVLGKIAPDAFERLTQRLLREAGFTKVEVRGKTGDGGIDGVGVLRVNLVSFQVYFQCKKWKGASEAVRSGTSGVHCRAAPTRAFSSRPATTPLKHRKKR